MQFLTAYDWKITYREGKLNNVADALSRRPDHQPEAEEREFTTSVAVVDVHALLTPPGAPPSIVQVCGTSCFEPEPEFLQQLKQAYAEDAQAQVILERGGNQQFSVKDGFLYKGNRLWISGETLQQQLLAEYHDTPAAGHRGIATTMDRVRQHCYWPRLKEDVDGYVAGCLVCQQSKPLTQAQKHLLQPLPVPERAFQSISMDFIIGLPLTKRGHDTLLVIVCRLTKWARFLPLRAGTGRLQGVPQAAVTAQAVYDGWIALHDAPEEIVSDRDTQFVRAYWKGLMALHGTRLRFSTAFHPQTDGQTERTNRTLEEMLRCYVSADHTDWDEHLASCTIAYNTSRQASTGESPHELVYGQPRRMPVDQMLLSSHIVAPAARLTAEQRQQQLEKAKHHLLRAQKRQARYANQHRREISFAIGEWVWVRTDHLRLPQHPSSKLKPCYAGPWKIVAKVGNAAYRLQLNANSKLHPVFYVGQLRRYRVRLDHFADDEGNPLPAPPELVDDHDEYEIERILGVREFEGKRQFLVKWLGYPAEQNTWENEEGLRHNASDMLSEFLKERALQQIQSLQDNQPWLVPSVPSGAQPTVGVSRVWIRRECTRSAQFGLPTPLAFLMVGR
jgi:hypothetical protein